MAEAAKDTAKVLWTSPVDIHNKSFTDWLAAHTSFCVPLHHWEGVVTLSDDGLELRGRHKGSKEERQLTIQARDVTDMYLGFDDVFTRCEDRSLGLTFKPLRLAFQSSACPQTLYLIINFKRWRRGSENSKWYDKLQAWRERQTTTAK